MVAELYDITYDAVYSSARQQLKQSRSELHAATTVIWVN